MSVCPKCGHYNGDHSASCTLGGSLAHPGLSAFADDTYAEPAPEPSAASPGYALTGAVLPPATVLAAAIQADDQTQDDEEEE